MQCKAAEDASRTPLKLPKPRGSLSFESVAVHFGGAEANMLSLSLDDGTDPGASQPPSSGLERLHLFTSSPLLAMENPCVIVIGPFPTTS